MSASMDTERLAGLVFELGSQLHVERARRLALEAALVQANVLSPGAVEAVANDPDVRHRMQCDLQESMRKLMRVLTESADARAPLREQAPKDI